MRVEDMILVSVDDHVVEPPDMFAQHLPAKWKDRAPHVEHRADGTDVWIYGDQVIPNIGLNAVAGRPKDEYGIEPTSFEEIRPGCYDIHERIKDMNAAGVLGSMNFPSYPGFAGRLFAGSPDLEAGLAILQAYNDWHVDEWCGTYPGRFIPLALPVLWDADLAAAEIRRVAAKGCHAVTFSENPEPLGFPSLHSPYWDPFWTACADEGTIVCMHIGSSGRLVITAQDAPVDVMITLQPMNIVQCAADLLWSPVLRKFPTLKFALSEGGIGWIPYFLDRVDRTYDQHHLWTGQEFGDKLPSQVFQERIVTCFIDDPVGVVTRHFTGIDTITWECDYPHSDSTWPYPGEQLQKALDGVPDDEIHQMTNGNAMRHFRFDPFTVRAREQSTVGALRAEAHGRDVAEHAQGKKKPRTGGILTGAAVQAQATA
jgi:predicted TIM-barrel fold metal-dependent hydrolase